MIINIHHSFLPSFPGAKPYHQTYERGVKLIRHHRYVTPTSTGPIIEQDRRVTHAMTPDVSSPPVAISRASAGPRGQDSPRGRVMLNGPADGGFSDRPRQPLGGPCDPPVTSGRGSAGSPPADRIIFLDMSLTF